MTVREDADGAYTVLIGNRRTQAAHMAGITELPCNIIEASDNEAVTIALQENMLRESLSAKEAAQAQYSLYNAGMSLDDIAKATGFKKQRVNRDIKAARLAPPDGLYDMDLVTLEKIERMPQHKEALLDAAKKGSFERVYADLELAEEYKAKINKAETSGTPKGALTAYWQEREFEKCEQGEADIWYPDPIAREVVWMKRMRKAAPEEKKAEAVTQVDEPGRIKQACFPERGLKLAVDFRVAAARAPLNRLVSPKGV